MPGRGRLKLTRTVELCPWASELGRDSAVGGRNRPRQSMTVGRRWSLGRGPQDAKPEVATSRGLGAPRHQGRAPPITGGAVR
jgi:hypothetical protein